MNTSESSRPKRLLILSSKLGYQTRSFAEAAQRLGVEVFFGSDRCHQLDNPWADDARALGIRHNSPESVEICRSKLRQREVLRAAGLPVPEFFSFGLAEPVDAVVPRVKFPCVVKPLSLAASQGVIRANDAAEFAAAVARIRALLGSPEIQVTREPGLDRLLVERDR